MRSRKKKNHVDDSISQPSQSGNDKALFQQNRKLKRVLDDKDKQLKKKDEMIVKVTQERDNAVSELDEKNVHLAERTSELAQEKSDHEVTKGKLKRKSDEMEVMQKTNNRISKKFHDAEDERDEALAKMTVMQDQISRALHALNGRRMETEVKSIPAEEPQTTPYPNTCFLMNDPKTIEKVKEVVKAYYKGVTTNLALIEIVLFDHSMIRKRNEHKAFVSSLINLGIIKKQTEKELRNITSGISNKLKKMPDNIYTTWGAELNNDRKTCEKIGQMLGQNYPLGR